MYVKGTDRKGSLVSVVPSFTASPPKGLLHNSSGNQETATMRFEMRMSERLFKALEMMSDKEGISNADIVRRALGLYAKALQAEEQGLLIGFGTVKEDGTTEIADLIRLNSTSPPVSSTAPTQTNALNERFNRFEMRMSEALLASLSKLSDGEKISKADLVRRALGLYARASVAAAKKQLIMFAKLDKGNNIKIVDMIRLK
jgi:hypothetical protein